MNTVIQKLLEDAGFGMWGDEEWGPGLGHIDWSSSYDDEFEQFLTLLADRIYARIEAQRNVDDYSDSLNIEYDQSYQLGFNAGLIIATVEVNKLLTGDDSTVCQS
jgi:hypothetical protein